MSAIFTLPQYVIASYALLHSVSYERVAFVHQLTNWGRDKMAVISQTAISEAFTWTKM